MKQNVSQLLSATSSVQPLIRGVIFDIDGVIFDSKEANTAYYNKIREVIGLPPMSPADIEYCHMATGNQALARIIPPEFQNEALERARNAVPYHEFVTKTLQLEDGLLETLHWLQAQRVLLGICTNRFTKVPELLDYFGIAHFFSSIKTAANVPPKPASEGLLLTLQEWELEPRQAVFIGDTEADQWAAQGAYMRFWAFGNPALTAEMHFTNFFSVRKALAPLVEKTD